MQLDLRQFKSNRFYKHVEFDLVGAFLIAAIVFFSCLPLVDVTTLSIFTARDTLRAQDLLRGHFIWFGPEISGEGWLTGPFYYYLLALPLALGGFLTSLRLEMLLFGLSAGVLWYHLKKTTDQWLTLALLVAYVGGNRLAQLSLAWNPSYLFFFWSILGALLYRMSAATIYRNPLWLSFCLLTGLVAQIHASSFYWFPIALLFLDRKRLPWAKVALGAFLVLIPQIPFLIFFNPDTPPKAGLWAGYIDTVLFFTKAGRWKVEPYQILRVFSSGMGAVLCTLLASTLGVSFVERIKIKKWPNGKLQSNLIYLLSIALLLATRSLIHDTMPHYLMWPMLIIMLLTTVTYNGLNDKKLKMVIPSSGLAAAIVQFYLHKNYLLEAPPTIYLWAVCALIIFLCWIFKDWFFAMTSTLLAVLIVPTISAFVHLSNLQIECLTTATSLKIAEYVYQNTGWDIDQFNRHAILAPNWPESSMEETYLHVVKSSPPPKSKASHNSGVIIMNKAIEKSLSRRVDQPRWKQWIAAGDFIVVKSNSIDNYKVIIYEITNRSLSETIHNIGDNYPRISEEFEPAAGAVATYEVPIFENTDAKIRIEFDQKAGTIALKSRAASRFISVGSSLQVLGARLTYKCDGKMVEMELPRLGYGPPDLWPYGRKLQNTGDVLLMPILFKNILCKSFLPVTFASKAVTLRTHFGKGQDLENFIFEF